MNNVSGLEACRVCSGKDTECRDHILGMPVHMWPVASKGPHKSLNLELHLCKDCGHAQLQSMTSELVGTFYEAGVFVEDNSAGHASRLSALKNIYGNDCLRGVSVLDIGGGNNPFVGLLPEAQRWVSDIVVTDVARAASDHVIEGDFPSANIADNSFDLITAFHTMEHFPEPALAVEKMAACLKQDGLVLIEVPNFEIYTRALPHYALFLQHQSYFHRQSLIRLMARFGLELDHMIREDIVLLAVFKKTGNTSFDSFGAYDFACRVVALRQKAIKYTSDMLQEQLKNVSRPMIYGAGGSTSTLLTVLPWLREKIVAVFDRSPEKHGKYIPGTDVRVAPPENIEQESGDALIFLASDLCELMSDTVSVKCVDAGKILSTSCDAIN
ncbi:MAG: class I SAM-dependent methyltransferase [Thalassospira sp.]|uniref:class I SAM-dependent methyltransferase n=1 Tax=Thalassospira sp. TaxID=1912094 RepID=UPI0032EE95E7